MTTSIKKRHITLMAEFAYKRIDQTDQHTLENFVQYVNATDSHGSLTPGQFYRKVELFLKYVAKACPASLSILADLLEIPPKGSELKPSLWVFICPPTVQPKGQTVYQGRLIVDKAG